MSYASRGANAVFNHLEHSGTFMVAEGLDVFEVKMPASLVGKTIAESGIRRKTGCTTHEGQLILIGSPKGESRFLQTFARPAPGSAVSQEV